MRERLAEELWTDVPMLDALSPTERKVLRELLEKVSAQPVG
jgi:hypothetical protein